MVTNCETERQTNDAESEIAAPDLPEATHHVFNDDDDVEDYEEVIDNNDHGDIIGNCKWFNKKLGYGFITVYTGARRGMNIFVHHSGITPLNSNFRTLRKGEYVHFNIVDGQNGLQATNVTGIMGGPLMCDNVESRRSSFDLSTSTVESPRMRSASVDAHSKTLFEEGCAPPIKQRSVAVAC